MKTLKSALFLFLLTLAAAAARAQSSAVIIGEVLDLNGKPFPEVVVSIKHEETGYSYEQKTDKSGRFTQAGLRSGIYIIQYKVRDQIIFQEKIRLATGQEWKTRVNFKELAAQQAEAQKKQQEEQQKFAGMKEHFDAGVAALDQAKQLQQQMARTPREQRAPLEQRVAQFSETAVASFQNAEKTVAADDPNLHIILAKLAESYEVSGKMDEAVATYQRAVALKPEMAGYANNLGNVLAKQGKVPEAMAAYEKAAAADPINAGNYWLNAGIVLYMANRLKDAVEPLKKATQSNPNAADAWYLLGASLLASIETKQEGDKLTYVVPPGTAEAYQKYLALAPNGRFAGEAQAALQSLEALGAGVQTKVKAQKKKKG